MSASGVEGGSPIAAAPTRSRAIAIAASLAGAALLSVPAQRFRIDAWGAECAGWPSIAGSAPYALAYLAAIALLGFGWLGLARAGIGARHAILVAAAVHATAILAPPFLSQDALCYAAIGRVIAIFQGSPYRPLAATLPPDDPFFRLLDPSWKIIGSAYWPAFHLIARPIGALAGDRIAVALRLYQGVAAASVLLAAWLTGRAVAAEDRGRAVVLVGLCPLAIVEATVNAHNDALLALAVSGWALAVARERRGAGLAAAFAGALVKASGLLLAAFAAAEGGARRLGPRVTSRRVLAVAAGGVGLVIVGFLVARERVAELRLIAALVGDPDARLPHCTRSIECLPRALLAWVLDLPRAAFLLGLAFRAAGGVWLLHAAARAARDPAQRTPIAAAATALTIYYLYLHGFMQSWYLLSLVPLLPHASPRIAPALRTFLVSALAYYAVRLPLQCDPRPGVVAAKELVEALIVIVPPTVVLLRGRARP